MDVKCNSDNSGPVRRFRVIETCKGYKYDRLNIMTEICILMTSEVTC